MVAPFSWPYWLACSVRNSAYDHQWLRSRRATVPVIAVGNLTVGGTGKSPVVAYLGQRLSAWGYHPAVIARGYKGGTDGRNDEALDSALPVFCDPQRIRAAAQAVALGHTILIADDAFQHRQLARDLDLVCLDASRPWGQDGGGPGRLVPAGRLREPRSSLRRAQGLIFTRCDQAQGTTLTQLDRLAQRLGIPAWHSCHAPVALESLLERQIPEHLHGQAVLATCGLAHPEAFFRTCRSLGMQVDDPWAWPDHHHFTQADVQALIARAQGRPIVVSSKDAVKLRPLWTHHRSTLWSLRIALKLQDPAGSLDLLLRRALSK